MEQNSLLVTRPNYDITTRIISAFAEEVLEFANSKGIKVFDLADTDANKAKFESMIKKHNPKLVFINGHGSETLVTGQDQEVLLEAGVNEEIMKGKTIYALSCRSASILGLESIKSGAKAYIGYRDDFIFQYSVEKMSRPKEDKTAALFIKPSNQIVISLLKGHTAMEAKENGREYIIRNIKELISSKTSSDSSVTLRYLVWNLQNLICHS
jgi:hypothetical protein